MPFTTRTNTSVSPDLVPVGQAYEDYRNHPLFTALMETFLFALLNHPIRFSFPRLWNTKAETLGEFLVHESNDQQWKLTRSCWQSSRQVSVSGMKRQCGICAACLLRRMSVHAVKKEEPIETYVWEDLTVSCFENGATPGFEIKKSRGAMYEYAIAAVLHLDHLANL